MNVHKKARLTPRGPTPTFCKLMASARWPQTRSRSVPACHMYSPSGWPLPARRLFPIEHTVSSNAQIFINNGLVLEKIRRDFCNDIAFLNDQNAFGKGRNKVQILLY